MSFLERQFGDFLSLSLRRNRKAISEKIEKSHSDSFRAIRMVGPRLLRRAPAHRVISSRASDSDALRFFLICDAGCSAVPGC